MQPAIFAPLASNASRYDKNYTEIQFGSCSMRGVADLRNILRAFICPPSQMATNHHLKNGDMKVVISSLEKA